MMAANMAPGMNREQVPAGEGAVVHREAQLGEEGVPEGQQLPHIQAQGKIRTTPCCKAHFN